MFGLGCVASWRYLHLRPFDVQLAAGVVLHQGALAEVATGEGKTLIAVLPAALNALAGKGVHVATVNDYLARRDCEWTAPVHNALGLTVGVLQQKMSDEDRAHAYKADITYGTASEFGFDFLRDRLKVKSQIQSGHAVLAPLDRARQLPTAARSRRCSAPITTPSSTRPTTFSSTRPARRSSSACRHAWPGPRKASSTTGPTSSAKAMVRDEHFYLDEKKQKVELTDKGRELIRYSNPPFGEHSHAMDKLHEHVERAIHANHRYRLDQHYMVDKRQGGHHRRIHRPASARSPLAEGLAPGGRGQGGRPDHGDGGR